MGAELGGKRKGGKNEGGMVEKEGPLCLPGRTELRFGHLCQHSSDFFLLIVRLPHVIQAYNSPGYIKDLQHPWNSSAIK